MGPFHSQNSSSSLIPDHIDISMQVYPMWIRFNCLWSFMAILLITTFLQIEIMKI